MNNVAECKVESFKKDSLPKTEIKIESKFYDGIACDFTISVKNADNAMFTSLAIMFSKYFACAKFNPNKDCPSRTEDIVKNLQPLALAVFREFCKQSVQDEEHGTELLEIWTNQAFELLQSGHGV